MKLAFVTMVWRDYWLLEKWIAHNAQWVPKAQLYVLNHGGDPKVDEIAEGCNVVHIPREEVTQDLTRRRWNLLGGVTNGILAFYDRVITTDVDELIFCTAQDGDLAGYLAGRETDEDALSPIGLNLIPTPDDGTDMTQTVLQRHPNALLSARYTKPCIVNSSVTFTIGGHGLIGGRFEIDPNLVLCHLHYVTPDYQERMAARADIVQQSRDASPEMEMPKNFWNNWADWASVKDKELALFDKTGAVDMSSGFGPCADILQQAVKHAGRRMVLKAKFLPQDTRKVVIPDAYRSRI